jgi:hypothetical protein
VNVGSSVPCIFYDNEVADLRVAPRSVCSRAPRPPVDCRVPSPRSPPPHQRRPAASHRRRGLYPRAPRGAQPGPRWTAAPALPARPVRHILQQGLQDAVARCLQRRARRQRRPAAGAQGRCSRPQGQRVDAPHVRCQGGQRPNHCTARGAPGGPGSAEPGAVDGAHAGHTRGAVGRGWTAAAGSSQRACSLFCQ